MHTDTSDHTYTHKHILCTHIHTHDPLPRRTVHQNTSLQRLPSASSCGHPSSIQALSHIGLCTKTIDIIQPDGLIGATSSSWKEQLTFHRSPADGIITWHPLQPTSHHTPSPILPSRWVDPSTSLTYTLITRVAVSGRRSRE